MLGSPELDAFIRESQWAVMTTLRGNGSPASSVVGYAIQGDELLVGADRASLKVRCLENDARVTMCVFSDDPHPRFATIEGRGSIQRDSLEDAKRRILSNTVPRGYPVSGIEAWLKRRETVVITIRASRAWGVLRPAI